MKLATEAQINIIRGKAAVGAASKADVQLLLDHIAALEYVLDEEANPEDMFGTEGWRVHFARVLRG